MARRKVVGATADDFWKKSAGIWLIIGLALYVKHRGK